jgi:glutamate N-acetyltransferase/amino-acid N-acetyltransferase
MRDVSGFRFAGVSAGIKANGEPDLGLIVAELPVATAAVFTSNRLPAAPVVLSRETLRASYGRTRACVVNSGNANALTGHSGVRDARRMQQATADGLGVPPEQVMVASTGVIGVPMPMERVESGIAAAIREARPSGFSDFARAILTTDKSVKMAVESAAGAPLLGCTKGAGMIAPDMATTLTFVVTDAQLEATSLQRSLGHAVETTFNRIAVDGDMSTNDMILVMASGLGVRPKLRPWTDALTSLLDDLARQLMRGGEGVHHVVAIEVRGAPSEDAARRVARAIAVSPLVKTAIAGEDPNFGRILAAAGTAGVPLTGDRLSLDVDEAPLLRSGAPVVEPEGEARARAVMQRPEYTIALDLGIGRASARYLACDLSHEYVSINADYRS